MRIFVAALVLTLLAGSSYAKSTDERVADLEKRLAAVQQTYLTNNAEIASALARSEAIQQEFAGVKGSVETNKHLIDAQRRDLMRLLQDLEHRLQAIEDRLEIFSTQINQAIGKVSPKVAEEGALYQRALSKANQGDYISAIADFQRFVKKFPKSTFAPNAQYWIGECYYSTKNFKRAIKEFQVFIEANRRHEKVPAAILKQGGSFYELGMLDEARPFFEKIIKEYPRSPEASQAQSKLEMVDQRKAQAKTTPSPATSSTTTSYPTETIQQQRERYRQQMNAGQTGTPSGSKKERGYTEF